MRELVDADGTGEEEDGGNASNEDVQMIRKPTNRNVYKRIKDTSLLSLN